MSTDKRLQMEMAELKKNSFRVITQLNNKVKKLEAAKREPIAIIGMACRYPGGVKDVDSYWKLLSEGLDAIEKVPSNRWDVDAIYSETAETGKMATREGGFLKEVDQFDAGFFDLTVKEATHLDPQHRIMLETTWDAFEHAGLSKEALLGSNTGVFAGLMSHEYETLHGTDLNDIDGFVSLGTASSVLSGRISYTLGLRGPSITLDTACSSSLVAIDMAVEKLRNGSCEMAIAGGVSLILTPALHVDFGMLQGLSKDGRCHTFSKDAKGVGWSEGCGVVILKPLSKAQAEGDNILALIKGSAVNQDGKSQGIAAPNGPSQEAVIRKALDSCSLSPEAIDYVECHGTGTSLGDPIEVQALGSVYGSSDRSTDALILGSVKSNMGHTMAAAGVAGVIKTILSMQNDLIPKSLHSEELSEKIDWDQYKVKVAQEAIPWEKGDRPRRAGVSSFGISGTNAHVILEEAPAAPKQEEREKLPVRPYQLLLVSGEGAEALEGQLTALQKHITDHPDQSIEALAYCLATTRSQFRNRISIVAKDRKELLSKLSETVEVNRPVSGKIAFLYTGGGAQYIGMGKELYDTEPVFTQTLDKCLTLIKEETGEDFKEIIFAKEGSKEAEQLDQIDYMLLALFSIEYSLSKLWQHWGVEPDLLMGHSLGEIVAATVAGVFSLEDGIKLVAARGKLMASVKRPGKMATVEANTTVLNPFLKQVEAVSIAGENGPKQTLISGASEGIEEIVELLEAAEIKIKVLPISQASHSPLMEEILEEFRTVARSITYQAPNYALISNVSGNLAGVEIQTAEYWTNHIRETVLFSTGMQSLEREGVTTYLEIGPQPTLTGMGAYCVTNSEDCQWLASIQPETSNSQTMLESLGQLYVSGQTPDWASFYKDREQQKIPLPTYAFQRKRYWIESKSKTRGGKSTGHPLLGSELEIVGEKVYEQELNLKDFAYLKDHEVFGQIIIPGAGIVELVQGFIHQQEESYELTELLIAAPLVLPKEGSIRVQLVTEKREESYEFKLHSQSKEGLWQEHASGSVSEQSEITLLALDIESKKSGLTSKDVGVVYDDFEEIGLSFGPAFQGISEVYSNEQRAFGKIVLKTNQDGDYHLHPTLLDGVFQLSGAIETKEEDTASYLPFEIGGYQLKSKERTGVVWAEVTQESHSSSNKEYSIRLWDESGSPLGIVERLSARKVDITALSQSGLPHSDWLYSTVWEPVELIPRVLEEGTWIVSREEGSERGKVLAEALADQTITQTLQTHNDSIPSGTTGIISLWEDEYQEDLPTATEQLTSVALIQLQQAIAGGAEEIIWVTRGVHAEEPNLVQSPLWGLLRVAMNEYPDVRFRLIDLAADSEGDLKTLVSAISSESREDQLRINQKGIAGLRLQPSVAEEEQEDLQLSSGTVLITGGLGALGLKVAEHLSTQYKVPHLLLLGRSKPRAGSQELIDQLTQAGTKVTVASCDTSDRKSLEGVIQSIPKKYPLKGVVHSAGVLDDGVLTAQDRERIHTSMLPKVYGGWYLHELTREHDLELFVLFSSVSSWFGGVGQGNYAASNLFLDQLSLYRKSQGLRSHTINWGPVSDVGLAAQMSSEEKTRIEEGGVRYFSSEEGLKLLDKILRADHAQMGVVPIKKHGLRNHLMNTFGYLPALFINILHQPKSKGASSAIKTDLIKTDSRERSHMVLNYLKKEMARLLHIEPSEIDSEKSLLENGLNSLQVLNLNNTLRKKLGIKTRPDEVLKQPNLGGITQLILASLENVLIIRKEKEPESNHETFSLINAIQEGGRKKPIFCCPGLGGYTTYLETLSKELGEDRPFYALEPLMWSDKRMPETMEEYAGIYISKMIEKQPEGAFLLAGHSIGGILALEIARQLSELGKQVDHIFLFDPILNESIFDALGRTCRKQRLLFFIFRYGLPETLAGHSYEEILQMIEQDTYYQLLDEALTISPLLDHEVPEFYKKVMIEFLFSRDSHEGFIFHEYFKSRLAIQKAGFFGALSARVSLFQVKELIALPEDPVNKKYWSTISNAVNKEKADVGTIDLLKFYFENVLVVEQAKGDHMDMLTGEYTRELAVKINESIGDLKLVPEHH